jgi:hypothetical protein
MVIKKINRRIRNQNEDTPDENDRNLHPRFGQCNNQIDHYWITITSFGLPFTCN